MANVYTKANVLRCEVKKLIYDGSFMDIPTITAIIESPTPIDFSVGDYLQYDYDGIRYTIQNSQSVKKNAALNKAGNAFQYDNVVFESPLAALKYIDFLDYVMHDTELKHYSTLGEFSFTGSVYDFAQRILANIRRIYSTGWNVKVMDNGVEVTSNDVNRSDGIYKMRDIAISGMKVFETFGTIYEQWNVSFVFKVIGGINTIIINDSLALTEPVEYGKGNGLYSLIKSVNPDHQITTRLRAFGNSKNLPAKYFTKLQGLESFHALSNLMIPRVKWKEQNNPATAYIDANDTNVGGVNDPAIANFGIRENTVRFDGTDGNEDIFPTIKGVTAGKLREQGINPDYTPKTVYPDNERIDLIEDAEIPDDDGLDIETGHSIWDCGDSLAVQPATPGNVPASGMLFLPNYMNHGTSDNYIRGQYILATYTPAKTRLFKFEFSGNNQTKLASITASKISNVKMVIYKDYITPLLGIHIPKVVGGYDLLVDDSGGDFDIYLEDTANNKFAIELTANETYFFVLKYEGELPLTATGDNSQVYVGTLKLWFGKLIYTDYFYLTLKQIGFKLDQYLTSSDSSIQITMNTGACAGRSFNYITGSCVQDETNDTWRIKIKRTKDDSMGQMFPNTENVINAGEEFVITGHIFPDFYVRIAEYKLFDAACAWLLTNKDEQFVYEVEIDNKIAYQLCHRDAPILIKEGMNLPIYDSDLGIGNSEQYEAIPIDNVTIEEGETPLPVFKVVLRKEKDGSQLTAAINKATKGYATSNEVKDIVSYEGGTSKHNLLSGRANNDQHPIDAISGLRDVIDSIPSIEKLAEYFLSKKNNDTASGQITFLDGLISDVIKSRGAVMNDFAGQGFILKMVDGKAKLELDEIVVRQVMKVLEILIQQWSWQGGVQIDSAAAIEAIEVTELESGYKVTYDKDKYKQKFTVNDQARCQRFDSDVVTIKYYWRLVTEVGDGYIVLSKTDKDGTGVPEAKDNIIQLGNRSNTNRQAAIIYTSVGENSPKIEFYGGIDDYNLASHRVTLVGMKDGAMTLVTSNGEFSGKVIIGAGSSGLNNIEGWNEIQSKIDSYTAIADVNKKVIDSLSDDSEFDISEKNSIRTMWENINGLNSLSSFGTSGSYFLSKKYFADFPFDAEKVLLSYDGYAMVYDEKLIVYNLWGVGELDSAYYNLRNYLTEMRLYTNRVKSGFDRVKMAAYFTAYYDAEIKLTNKINDYKAKALQEGIVAATRYSIVLTNDNASIACDANGNVVGTLPTTKASVYYGGTLASGWTLSLVNTGCVARITGTSGGVTSIEVTSIQLDNAEVLVVAEKDGFTAINAAFTLTKVRAGIGFNGFEEYYCWGNSGTVVPSTPLAQWTKNAIPSRPADTSYRYLWNYEKILKNEGDPVTTTPICLSVDGKEVSSITEYYATTVNYTEPVVGSSLWGAAGVKAEPTTARPYLWNKTVTIYTDGTSQTTINLIAQRGEDGVSYTGTAEYYQWGTSGTTAPTGTWTANTVPSQPSDAAKYLWNYERISKSDGTSTDTNAHCIGSQGKGIKAVSEYYMLTSTFSKPSASASGWQSDNLNPTASNPYLWNKTVTIYTDGTSESQVYLLAKRGDDGNNGENGNDAIIYWVEPSVNIVKKSWAGVLTPTSISCIVMKQVGNAAATNITSAAIASGASPKLYYQLSNGNLIAYSSAVSLGNAAYIDFVLKQGSTILDKERVPVLVDASDLDLTDIETAISDLEDQQTDFNIALAKINSDTVLTAGEKKELRSQWEIINGGDWGANGTTIGATGTFQSALDLIAKSGFDAATRPSAAGDKQTAYDNLLTAKNNLGNKTNSTGAFFTLRTYLKDTLHLYGNDDITNFSRTTLAGHFTSYYSAHEKVIMCVNEWYRVMAEELMSQFDYLKQTLNFDENQSVELGDGIALAGMLGVKNYQGNVVAGMFGGASPSQSDDSLWPIIFGGAASAGGIKTALWRVFKSGIQKMGKDDAAQILLLPDATDPKIEVYDSNHKLSTIVSVQNKEGLANIYPNGFGSYSVDGDYGPYQTNNGFNFSDTIKTFAISGGTKYLYTPILDLGFNCAVSAPANPAVCFSAALKLDGVVIDSFDDYYITNWRTVSNQHFEGSTRKKFNRQIKALSPGTHTLSITYSICLDDGNEMSGMWWIDALSDMCVNDYANLATHLFANGISIGRSQDECFVALAKAGGVDIKICNGSGGIAITNADGLCLRINGRWYQLSIGTNGIETTPISNITM